VGTRSSSATYDHKFVEYVQTFMIEHHGKRSAKPSCRIRVLARLPIRPILLNGSAVFLCFGQSAFVLSDMESGSRGQAE
jgi:hypothetical protein